MGRFLKENYFTLVRVVLMLVLCTYGCMENVTGAGVSVEMLLLVMCTVSVFLLKETAEQGKRLFFYPALGVLLFFLLKTGSMSFLLLVYFFCIELLRDLRVRSYWYFLMYLTLFAETPAGFFVSFLVITMLLICYLQHEFVVNEYQNRMLEDTIVQQRLKQDMKSRDSEAKAELERNKLMAENRILEERAELSQTLHDKLGHNINGSIYQLEASKVIMEDDPERAKGMLQAVIDQLRTGMDEIRAILRKKRPEKKQMALLQLYELCADCNEKGVCAELATEGDLSAVSDDIWEVILDNAYEAVTNSMKYAKCERIDIHLVVLNKMIRCSIFDDGIGCNKIEDGMGISGMRKRVRTVGGTIGFETHPGFRVDMVIPIGG